MDEKKNTPQVKRLGDLSLAVNVLFTEGSASVKADTLQLLRAAQACDMSVDELIQFLEAALPGD